MEAGRLSKRVTIEAPHRQPNSLGEPIITWTPVSEVWASVTPLNARETVRTRQAEFNTTHVVKLRWTPALTPDCRLTYASAGRDAPRVLNITGIVNVEERNRELEVSAVEVTGGEHAQALGVEFQGRWGLSKLLRDLPPRVKKKGLRKALTAAATPIAKTARKLAGKRTGTLRKSITKKLKTYPGGNVVALIGANRETAIPNPWGDGKPQQIIPANYLHLVERGHGGPHAAKAHPFLAPAYAKHAETSGKIATDKLNEVLKQEAKKLGRARK